MARIGITYEQVAQQADLMAANGQQPTIKALREALGGTGSPNTIHRHLTTRTAARPVKTAQIVELPQSLTLAISEAIRKAASQARSEIEGALVQAHAEAADLATAGEAIEAERDALAEQVATLSSERDKLAGKAAQQAADLVEYGERVEREQNAAEAARVELARVQLRGEAQAEAVKNQALEIERLRAALESVTAARVSADQQAAVLVARLEGMTERATKAEARIELNEKYAQQFTQELNSYRVQVQAQQGALDTAVRDIAQANDSAGKARAEAKRSGEEAAELRGQLVALAKSQQAITAPAEPVAKSTRGKASE